MLQQLSVDPIVGIIDCTLRNETFCMVCQPAWSGSAHPSGAPKYGSPARTDAQFLLSGGCKAPRQIRSANARHGVELQSPKTRLMRKVLWRTIFGVCFSNQPKRWIMTVGLSVAQCDILQRHPEKDGRQQLPCETLMTEGQKEKKRTHSILQPQTLPRIEWNPAILCCEVIIWAKFGPFKGYYLGQVGVVIRAKVLLAYLYSGFERFLDIQL